MIKNLEESAPIDSRVMEQSKPADTAPKWLTLDLITLEQVQLLQLHGMFRKLLSPFRLYSGKTY